jgi:DNA-binding Lrp family transcriptional regulator
MAETSFPFDKFSRRILEEIQRNSRITVNELSDRVGLSSSPCWRRIKDLEEQGIVTRYTALLDRRRVGLGTCMYALVTLARHNQSDVEAFEARVRERDEVMECYEITGTSDYMLKVLVPEIADYDRFLHEVIFKLPGVSQVRTSVALREVKYETRLPLSKT